MKASFSRTTTGEQSCTAGRAAFITGQSVFRAGLSKVGMPDVKEKLLKGYKAGDRTYKVHLDGYNFLPYLTGKEQKPPRQEFFYFSDDGDLTGLRYDNWKLV